MLAYLISSGDIRTETISPRDKPSRQIWVEICDLYVPGKRHPVELKKRVNDEQSDVLEPGKKYFLGGPCFGTTRYDGLEFLPYEVGYVLEDDLIDWLSSPENAASTPPPLSAVGYDD